MNLRSPLHKGSHSCHIDTLYILYIQVPQYCLPYSICNVNSTYLNFDEERDEHLQSALHSIKSKLIFYEQIALKKEIVVLTLVYGMNSMAKLQ